MNFMRFSLQKAAHALLAGVAQQKIRVLRVLGEGWEQQRFRCRSTSVDPTFCKLRKGWGTRSSVGG
jgi:hypothetical protein